MKVYRDNERQALSVALQDSHLSEQRAELLQLYDRGWEKILRHGDLPRWQAGFENLPDTLSPAFDLSCDRIGMGQADETQLSHAQIKEALQKMHPWRKGPFDFFGVHIDTEWHSDWKWQRLQQHISPLKQRTILDVGCGSGYHIWRMLGEQAKLVIGIDPTPLFSMHFATIKRYIPDAPAFLLPVGIDDMPKHINRFDSIFSMGILYHRKSPLEHLSQLHGLLRSGGELVLETLIVDGDANSCLVPHGRYAKMRNVWFIPSVRMLEIWLMRCGFKHIRCVDVAITSVEEQRSTEWMQFESLADFLDPHDASQTVEGYPAPQRAVFIATAT